MLRETETAHKPDLLGYFQMNTCKLTVLGCGHKAAVELFIPFRGINGFAATIGGTNSSSGDAKVHIQKSLTLQSIECLWTGVLLAPVRSATSPSVNLSPGKRQNSKRSDLS
jgi:hypothetical protein